MPASRSVAAERRSVSLIGPNRSRRLVTVGWYPGAGVSNALAAGSKQAVEAHDGSAPIRLAAAGDIHCRPEHRDEVVAAFARVAGAVDAILLAGDLTTHGEPAQAAVLAEACRDLGVPVVAVLGNHDWHAGRRDELAGVLEEAGVILLDPGHVVLEVGARDLAVVGAKGFVGGFSGSHIPDFGEPSMRALYAEATTEVEALDRGLREVSTCAARVVLLHYAPTAQTLAGERRDIWAFLGTDRLAAPIVDHDPHLVLHGHAHAGTFRGAIGEVPVYNVSVPVMGRDFALFELAGASAATAAVR
jgi:Icc-related predicted phosphoesterase